MIGAFFLVLATAAAATVEPRTGINFSEKHKGSTLSKVRLGTTNAHTRLSRATRLTASVPATLVQLGVRYKGPIKVYAVGEYDSGTFLLKMSYGVGAQKMVSALGDALKPRIANAKLIEEFEDVLRKGLPDGAPKGTVLEFATGGSKLGLSVNSKSLGFIGSKALCSAFAGIYTDPNAVCVMSDIGDDGEAAASCSCLTPAKRGALVGAAAGFLVGKVMG